jgi:hypothetical protein
MDGAKCRRCKMACLRLLCKPSSPNDAGCCQGGGGGGNKGITAGACSCRSRQQKIYFALFVAVIFSVIFAFLTTSYLKDSQLGFWAEGECFVVNVTWQNYLHPAGHDTFWLQDFWAQAYPSQPTGGENNDSEAETFNPDVLFYVQEHAYDFWYEVYNATSGFSDDPALHLNDSTWREKKIKLSSAGWLYSVVVLHESQLFISSIKSPSRSEVVAPMHEVADYAPCVFRYLTIKYEDALFFETHPDVERPRSSSSSGEEGEEALYIQEVFWKDVNGDQMTWEKTSKTLRTTLMVMSFFLLLLFLVLLKVSYDYHDAYSNHPDVGGLGHQTYDLGNMTQEEPVPLDSD